MIGLDERKTMHVRLAMAEIEVEGIFRRIVEAERARAATVIQQRDWTKCTDQTPPHSICRVSEGQMQNCKPQDPKTCRGR